MSGTAAVGSPGSTHQPSSSAASAANGATNASLVNHHQQQQGANLRDVLGVATLMVRIAQHVRSYSQLAYFRLIDTNRQPPISPVRPISLTPDILLPILTRLLPIVVASLGLGVFVEVPTPQLAQGVAVTLAIRALMIEQLSRWLWMMERGGKWGRWKLVLEMLYLVRDKRPLVLGNGNFGVFASRAAFLTATEAIRQWKILSWGLKVNHRTQQGSLMDGDKILCHYGGMNYCLPTVLTCASHLFPPDAFDPADPPAEMNQWTYRTYTSMVAHGLFDWLTDGGHIHRIRFWVSGSPASAASRRVCDLLAASPSSAAQWGAGAAVFDKKKGGDGHHDRLVVCDSEAMGERQMAIIRLGEEAGSGKFRYVSIYTTVYAPQYAPHEQTRTTVMRALGDHLGGKVWRGEDE
ncbi:unnamed protein product [Vitrella brassicaformis CCMP3155]|uniref:Uncharacterized protein n=1 Tax=Vitrella brassicaformis (strain CCMP3155) TaxID=1169540 RepID=A0A0G4EB43_VITBC|nr:unnamed protein product [Vitrella brassicaformis CCMP3155]|eukprot:CEL93174.1 unnamed protein product [Vitrella brassicaformis CCMP3155]